MDYEKKYKEIVGQIKKAYLYAQTDSTKAVLEEIFPELKESEDEKVRKALAEMMFDTTGDELWVDYNVHKEEALAWLEKQGEPMEINLTEFYTRLQNLIGKFDNLPKEDLIGSLSFWMNVVQNDGTYKPDKKQSEQKPAWSEEDNEHAESILERLDGMCKKGATFTTTRFAVNQDIDWLKSIKQRIEGE